MFLSVRDLRMSFGPKRVLDGVSFDVEAGEAVAIMGPNGAGKTTTLKCVLGLLRCSGEILVDGLDARRRGVEARGRIGYVPQAPPLGHFTAEEFVHFVGRLRGVADRAGDEALALVGLEPDRGRAVREFSGGMRQRLSLAAALLGDPPLLLLDEPTANLDPEARAKFLELLRTFRAHGKTLVISSHRTGEVRGLADRVILLAEGKVASAGPPEEVLPPESVGLHVTHCNGEKEALRGLLRAGLYQELPTTNGSLRFSVPSDEAVAAVERLHHAGVTPSRIRLYSIEEADLR